MDDIAPVELLKRQYLQLIDPEELTLPLREFLILPETQSQIYNGLFDESRITYAPPERYRFRVLKRVVKALEDAVEDPEEDPLPSASAAAQQKSYVTYTMPIRGLNAAQVTLLEAPSLLASSGTTGFRTWEAALFLAAYLSSSEGNHLVTGKDVLELGSGTGFLSILCAKHLGAQRVLATDGSQEVISDLKSNIHLNELEGKELIQTAILQWGHALIGGVADCREEKRSYDLVLGADVTYDLKSIPSLIATMRDIFELYSNIRTLISATVRNEQTFDAFTTACDKNGFTLEQLSVPMPEKENQMGFFVPTTTAIKILLVTKEGPTKDPFAL
ncbi:hypothetical protein HO133_009111 [Letharia lupina]|uniref:Uncharacterized protein n=1 Tax=Letharia lupina TaxID=560253 RepID=A0A8H6CM90_9LECA|nr:uncharacterized protein HO133_009111 [Letharia lupina]KAF6226245.1 hypothetical protein HO133_009111 [Letharia lupina]